MQIKAKSAKAADLKAFLEAEKERLQKEITRGDITAGEERAGYGNHMAEGANVVFEQARNVGIRRDLERLLDGVNEALERLADGTHGICRHCGKPIDSARLVALPTASHCLTCQEKHEIH